MGEFDCKLIMLRTPPVPVLAFDHELLRNVEVKRQLEGFCRLLALIVREERTRDPEGAVHVWPTISESAPCTRCGSVTTSDGRCPNCDGLG